MFCKKLFIVLELVAIFILLILICFVNLVFVTMPLFYIVSIKKNYPIKTELMTNLPQFNLRLFNDNEAVFFIINININIIIIRECLEYNHAYC